MPRFRGRYNYSIDEKGRVNIPSKFRKLLSPEAEETFVVFQAPDGCLWALPLDEWEKFEDRLLALPLSKNVNQLQRTIQNTLNDTKLDRQGRISITQFQAEIAGISKDVSIIGRGDHLEIWDSGRLKENAVTRDEFDKMFYSAFQITDNRD